MTSRPWPSTPPVTGEAWGRPSDRVVISTMWCRGRTNSSNPSRSTVVFVAMLRAMPGTLPAATRDLGGALRPDPPQPAGEHDTHGRSATTEGDRAEQCLFGRTGEPQQTDEHADQGAGGHEAPGRPPVAVRASQPVGVRVGGPQVAHPPEEQHEQPEKPTRVLGPRVAGQTEVLGVQPRHEVDTPSPGMGERVPDDVR